jgi:hypothetical protein
MEATNNSKHQSDEMRPEYDLSELRGAVRGKYQRAAALSGDNRLDELNLTLAFPTGGFSSIATEPGSAEARAFIRRMDNALMPLFSRCVLPLYGDHRGVPLQCGTGTLFRVADISFLVTASHVTDLAAKQGVQLYISDSLPSSPGLPLEGRLHSERNVDVAVWQLPDQVVCQLANRTFLTVHQADRTDAPLKRGWYCIHGYPGSWSKVNANHSRATVKAFTCGTVLFDEDTSSFAGYDPRVHLLLSVPSKGAIDSDGEEADLPESLKGISGSSLWQAYYEGLASNHWTVDDSTVVAVQTGTYANGTVVRGTRWWVVDEIIRKNYPTLAGPLSLTMS